MAFLLRHCLLHSCSGHSEPVVALLHGVIQMPNELIANGSDNTPLLFVHHAALLVICCASGDCTDGGVVLARLAPHVLRRFAGHTEWVLQQHSAVALRYHW
eukprot:s3399_g20.t1